MKCRTKADYRAKQERKRRPAPQPAPAKPEPFGFSPEAQARMRQALGPLVITGLRRLMLVWLFLIGTVCFVGCEPSGVRYISRDESEKRLREAYQIANTAMKKESKGRGATPVASPELPTCSAIAECPCCRAELSVETFGNPPHHATLQPVPTADDAPNRLLRVRIMRFCVGCPECDARLVVEGCQPEWSTGLGPITGDAKVVPIPANCIEQVSE